MLGAHALTYRTRTPQHCHPRSVLAPWVTGITVIPPSHPTPVTAQVGTQKWLKFNQLASAITDHPPRLPHRYCVDATETSPCVRLTKALPTLCTPCLLQSPRTRLEQPCGRGQTEVFRVEQGINVNNWREMSWHARRSRWWGAVFAHRAWEHPQPCKCHLSRPPAPSPAATARSPSNSA